MLDLSVVVPVRNAELFIDECLASIARSEPREIIVVDGMSTDKTLEIARRYPVKIMSDEGGGVATARMIGTHAAVSTQVALIDVDILLPEGALAHLLEEFQQGQYTALQAGLHNDSGPGYWGRALVNHHESGRSKNWPGVMATIIQREFLLRLGFDERFRSGEDIELRWRLRRAGARLGVSRRVYFMHRFEDTFECARGQWLADGFGLSRMVGKYGWQASYLLGLPLAACVRGIGLSLVRLQLIWLPYYLGYLIFNYMGMVNELRDRSQRQLFKPESSKAVSQP